jgi:hypothetical protein
MTRHESRRALAAGLLAALAAATVPATAHAGWIERMQGHMAVGYAKAFMEEDASGSVSFGAGVRYPLKPDLALGLSVDYHLLGSATLERGILTAEAEYSLFDGDLALHWNPDGLGPLHVVTLFAGVAAARAELTTAPGGNAFLDVGLSEAAPDLGAALTFISAKPSPVRVGLELSGRVVVLEGDDWGVFAGRVVFHY